MSMWHQLETKEQQRRDETIHRSRTEIVAPKQAGDEKRGWWRHWRRGVEGALVGWAGGSLGVIIYMLAFAAIHFQVQEHRHASHPAAAEAISRV